MNILKKNIKWIILIVLGIVISCGISVYATSQYLASQVTYNNTNVKSALDDLYTIASSYIKLDKETTVDSTKLLNGVTAYDDSGNLITGIVSTNCVSGSYLYKQQDIDNNGVTLVNFEPKMLIIYAPNTNGTKHLWYYNSEVNSNIVNKYTLDSNNSVTNSEFVSKDSELLKINREVKIIYGSGRLNQTISYIACQ